MERACRAGRRAAARAGRPSPCTARPSPARPCRAAARSPGAGSARTARAGAPWPRTGGSCGLLLPQRRQAVLRGDRDRLEQRADRRRVDVLHPREVVERRAALGREGEEVTALLDALAAVDLAADEPPRPGFGQQLDVCLRGAREVPGARDTDAL